MAPRSSAAALGPRRFRAPTASERPSAWRSAGAGLALLAEQMAEARRIATERKGTMQR